MFWFSEALKERLRDECRFDFSPFYDSASTGLEGVVDRISNDYGQHCKFIAREYYEEKEKLLAEIANHVVAAHDDRLADN